MPPPATEPAPARGAASGAPASSAPGARGAGQSARGGSGASGIARILRVLAPIAVLAVAAALRFWALGRPGSLVFDELYYVRDAVSQLANGFPTTWPDDDPAFGGERASAFSDQASTIAHPPLGKWLIGLGILLFGVDTGWGWRSAVALAGVATVGVTMRLGWLLTRNLWIACLAGLLLAIDGVHVVLTRVGLLDGFLALFIVLGALFVWRDLQSGRVLPPTTSEIRAISDQNPENPPKLRESPKKRAMGLGAGQAAEPGDGWVAGLSSPTPGALAAHRSPAADPTARTTSARSEISLQSGENPPIDPTEVKYPTAVAGWHLVGRIAWRRPWLLAAGLTFGAAAAIKWSGLYPLAAFLIGIVVVDVLRRYRARTPRPLLGGALQGVVTAAIALPAAALAYLASWAGWIASPGGQNRNPGEPWWVSLWQWHADALAWHATLSAPHPYQSSPLTWPLALRPTAMYETRWGESADCPWAGGCVAAISPLPNALVTWGGVAALLVLLWVVVRSTWIAMRARTLAPLWHPAIGAAAFVLVGYLSGWLPWVVTLSRSAVFQFYAVVLTPFAALALALVLGALLRAPSPGQPGLFAVAGIKLDGSTEAVQGRALAVAVFVAVALAVAILFFPVWSGMPIAEWFWRAHLWLPGWD